jgi:4-carboxymuconolactone decarboxylase
MDHKTSPTGRVPDVALDEMSADQKRIHDEIAGRRGGVVRGPFALWMRKPEIADAANKFGNVLRVGSSLEKRLFELMVLVVARHHGAQYEWFAHAHQAISAGIPKEAVEQLRNGHTPALARDDERLVYDVTREIVATSTLSQETYERATAWLGTERLIEFVTAVSFYVMVALMLNCFQAPVPDGSRPLPDFTPA